MIRSDLVVKMPSSQACGRRFDSPLVPNELGGLVAIYKCATSWRVVYGSFATARPLGTNRKRGGFPPSPGFYIIAVWPRLLRVTSNRFYPFVIHSNGVRLGARVPGIPFTYLAHLVDMHWLA